MMGRVFPRGYVNLSGESMSMSTQEVDPAFPRHSRLIDYVLGLGSRAGQGSHPGTLTPEDGGSSTSGCCSAPSTSERRQDREAPWDEVRMDEPAAARRGSGVDHGVSPRPLQRGARRDSARTPRR
jgi:hypothetical protein